MSSCLVASIRRSIRSSEASNRMSRRCSRESRSRRVATSAHPTGGRYSIRVAGYKPRAGRAGRFQPMMGGMDLGPLLAAHADLRVERPPVLWAADVGDVALGRMLGGMLAAGVRRRNDGRELVVRVNNGSVSSDSVEMT